MAACFHERTLTQCCCATFLTLLLVWGCIGGVLCTLNQCTVGISELHQSDLAPVQHLLWMVATVI